MDECSTSKFEPKQNVLMNEVFVSYQSGAVCWYLCVQEPILYERSDKDQRWNLYSHP